MPHLSAATDDFLTVLCLFPIPQPAWHGCTYQFSSLGFWITLNVIVNPQCPNNPHSHPKCPRAVLFSSNLRGEPSQNINHKHSSFWALGLNLYGPQAHMGIAQVGCWMPSQYSKTQCFRLSPFIYSSLYKVI